MKFLKKLWYSSECKEQMSMLYPKVTYLFENYPCLCWLCKWYW